MNEQDPAEIEAILQHAFEPPKEGSQGFDTPSEGRKGFEYSADVSDIDLTDNSLEASLIREDSQRDGVSVPDLPGGEPITPESLFDADPIADTRDIIRRAYTVDFDFAKIEVDAIERDRFYRCGLHDEEMWYTVEVPNTGLTFKVAIPPISRSEAAVATVDYWVDTEVIGKNSLQYLHNFQLVNVWLMVREVNSAPTDWYAKLVEEAEGGKLTYRALRTHMANPDFLESVRDLNDLRWNATCLAVRIADYKHQLCLEAVRSRKVFTTADSA